MFNTRRNQELWNIQSQAVIHLEWKCQICRTMHFLTECLHIIWCPRKREALVLGLLCTVTQFYSLFLKFRSKEGGKWASWGMYTLSLRGHSSQTVVNGASHGETAKNHRTQEKPILSNCSSVWLACSGCGLQPFSNVGHGPEQVFGGPSNPSSPAALLFSLW